MDIVATKSEKCSICEGNLIRDLRPRYKDCFVPHELMECMLTFGRRIKALEDRDHVHEGTKP